MNAPERDAAPEFDRDPDPREALDLCKRAEIASLARLGCSRRMCAELVGCHHATIARTAARHPEFARQLADAEGAVDIAALERIQKAGEENKNWRAAAWVLERRHPEEFGRHTPHTINGDQVMKLLARIFDFTIPVVPEDKVKEFLREFNLAMRDVEAETRQPSRWRTMAGIEDAGSRHLKYFRSPYDHPRWHDPTRPDRLVEEMPDPKDPVKFKEWMHGLNAYEFEAVCRKVRETAQQERELQQAAKDGRLEAVTGLKFSEVDGPADGDGASASGEASPQEPATHGDLSAEREEYVEARRADASVEPPVPNHEEPLLEDITDEATEADVCTYVLSAERAGYVEVAAAEELAHTESAVLPEQTCRGRTGKSIQRPVQPPANQPPAHVTFPPPIPLLNDRPPTPEVHQAYQRLCECLGDLAARNLFATNNLRQQAPGEPAVVAPLGGAQVGWQARSPARR
jgi:hypothetical protein